MSQQEIIAEMFSRGVLLSKDLLEKTVHENVLKEIEIEEDLILLNSDYVEIISQQCSLVDWHEIDSYRVESERGNDELYQHHLQKFKSASLLLPSSSFQQQHQQQHQQQQEVSGLETTLSDGGLDSQFHTTAVMEIPSPSVTLAEDPAALKNYPVTIVVSFQNKARKYDVKHFTSFFVSRYRFLEGLLRHRPELEQVLPISRIVTRKEKEAVAVIGLVDEIGLTKNGNLMLTLEDLTGKIKILITQARKELLQMGKDIIFDEVVGITGVSGDKIIFAENIVWPDIPGTHELKKSPVEEFVIFLSDVHVGSSLFLHEEFQRFLSWIRGEAGNDSQKALAAKVKYIIVAGDLVDGVGIYPSQEDELAIKDIREQYVEFARLIRQIPPDKQIIMCPGNHDVVHLAEPQSVFYKDYALPLFSLPNVTLVSNPSMVTVAQSETFSGLDILLYHGYSFDYYVNNV